MHQTCIFESSACALVRPLFDFVVGMMKMKEDVINITIIIIIIIVTSIMTIVIVIVLIATTTTIIIESSPPS